MSIPDSIDKHVGFRIAFHRSMLGVEAKELSRETGLSIDDIAQIEAGLQRVPADKLLCVVKALRIDISALFRGKTIADEAIADPMPKGMAGYASPDELVALTRSFVQIPDADVRAALVDLSSALQRYANSAR